MGEIVTTNRATLCALAAATAASGYIFKNGIAEIVDGLHSEEPEAPGGAWYSSPYVWAASLYTGVSLWFGTKDDEIFVVYGEDTFVRYGRSEIGRICASLIECLEWVPLVGEPASGMLFVSGYVIWLHASPFIEFFTHMFAAVGPQNS